MMNGGQEQLDFFGKSYQSWLSEAREDLHGRLRAGEALTCPCCDQYCKVYRRKLNSSMARYLIEIVKEFQMTAGAWVRVPELHVYKSESQRGDYAYLTHWGFIEQKRNENDPTRKESGLWRPTESGIAFAFRRLSAPRHVYLYDNQLLKVSDETIDIEESLGVKFDYSELMQPAPLVEK